MQILSTQEDMRKTFLKHGICSAIIETRLLFNHDHIAMVPGKIF